MMHRLVASKQTVMQLLIGSSRACMVAQPAQRFSVVNIENVSFHLNVARINKYHLERILYQEEEGQEGPWRGI
jgi:hypothetical protein